MFNKIELPYEYNALEPYIDATTVDIHYNKHLGTYEMNLNSALESWADAKNYTQLEELLKDPSLIPEGIRQAVINNGGGVYNHNLYFSILSPNPKKEPTGKLLQAINEAFGDVTGCKNQLSAASVSQFGSGYGCLVKDSCGKLFIKQVANQNTTLGEGLTPILNIDVWEHAYYLKYQNMRKDYAERIWEIIDWARVEQYYEGQGCGNNCHCNG